METSVKRAELTNTAKLQIGLAFFAFILIGINDGGIGVLIPSIQQQYGVDKGTVALLFLMSTIGYLVGAFNSGWLVGRLGYRRFLLVGVGIFALGTLLIGLSLPFGLLLPVLILIGFGVSVVDAGLNSYVAGLAGSTVLLNYMHAFYGIGALLGPIVASTFLAVQLPWHGVYFLYLGLSLVVSIGLVLWYDDSGRVDHKEEHPEGNNLLRLSLRTRAVWLAAFFLLFYVGGEVGLGNWSYSLLTQDRHQPELLSGWVVSGYWLGLTLGRLTLARLAQRWGINDWRLVRYCLVGVFAGVFLLWLSPWPPLADFGLMLVGYSLGPLFPTTIALLPNLVPARLVATAVGFVASLGSMGAAFFPWLVGNLAQQIGLWTLMPYMLTLALLMLGCWIFLQNQHTRPAQETTSEKAA